MEEWRKKETTTATTQFNARLIMRRISLSLPIYCLLIMWVGGGRGQSAIGDDGQKIFNWILDFVGFGTSTTTTSTTTEVPRVCETCVCGVSNKRPRVINGLEVVPNKYPWMVYLTYRGNFLGGATLISDRYLLTAANTLRISKLTELRAVFLHHNVSSPLSENSFEKRIIGSIKHEDFVESVGYDNNIALLKLEDDVKFTDRNMHPICLPDAEIGAMDHNEGTILGWGSTQEFGNYSSTLQKVNVPIWSDEHCKESVYGDKITDNMICAGFPEGGKDACKGDGGGPLFITHNGHTTLVGIISWGRGCANPNTPGVYTKVNNYITWILKNTQDACYCDI